MAVSLQETYICLQRKEVTLFIRHVPTKDDDAFLYVDDNFFGVIDHQQDPAKQESHITWTTFSLVLLVTTVL